MSDSGDDWYADYDPNAYKQYDSSSNGYERGERRGGGGRGGGGRGGGGSYSRGGSGHDYTRDTSRDTSNVDEAAVDALLSERIAAKRSRDYDTADAIRDQLLQDFGVGVYDKERTWRTGASAGGSGQKFGGGGRRQQGGRRGGSRDRDFGPNGHDYELSDDAGANASSLSEDEIHAMIAERLQAKLGRDFQTADRIQYELLNSGVYVHDGMKEWRADGVPFGDFAGQGGRPGRTQGSISDRNRPYNKSEYSLEVEGTTDEDIRALVEERSKYKSFRDYLNADRIRDDLMELHNVFIDDRLREWSVGGNFGEEYNQQREMSRAMKSRGYVKSDSSPDLPSPADEEYVQGKIDERQEAKNVRDYDTADAIRDELLDEFDVVIHDKLRKWSVGGDFGDELPKRPGDYVRRGGGDLSEDDVATITSMVAERAQAKKDRNFDVADDIRAHLRDTYEVTVDDRSREWRVDSDEYVQSPLGRGARELTDEEVAIVQAKIEERTAFKRNRDYDAADMIRDELADTYSVLIDDRTKEWKTVEDDSASDKFAADAMISQTSAFKRKQIDEELDDEFESIFDFSGELEDPDDDDDDDDSLVDDDNDSLEDEEVSSDSEDELSSLTVAQLREKLRAAGMPVSGTKAVLVERLLA